jgi:hypothetical protein
MRKLFVVIGAALSLGILGAGWAAAEDLGPEKPARSWWARCSPIPASKAHPVWAAFSPTARS